MIGGGEGVSDAERKQREEDDRNQRKWTFRATILTAVSASFAAAFALGAFIEADRQVDELKAQTTIFRFQEDVAREALVATDRPWVAYEMPEAKGAAWHGGTLGLTLDFELKNAGHSPALKIRAAVGPLREPGSIPTPTDASCSGYTEPGLVQPSLGHFLLPDGTWPQSAHIVEFKGSDLHLQGRLVGPVRLVACVAYTRTGYDRFRVSRRVFDVGVKDRGAPASLAPFTLGVDVPAADLIVREDIGGNFAD